MFFNEDLLHYVWKFGLYNSVNLKTEEGCTLKIISPGISHHDAGPDFQNAKLQIGEVLWAGNVEIHVRSSDWMRHGHERNAAYNSVILHVVYQNDQPVYSSTGREIPVLALENRIEDELIGRYQNLLETQQVAFPCQRILKYVDDFTVQNWLDRMLLQRLEQKTAHVLQTAERLNGNWEEAFYQVLAASFGFKINALPFELLAKSLPLRLLEKHHFNLVQTEALLFGQAGFLEEEMDDPYFSGLQKEYRFLKNKYSLVPVEQHLWKFLRLRPLNFPTIRIAQFAALMHRNTRFLSEIIEAEDFTWINALFTGINPSGYWQTHYQFGKTAKPCSKKLGKSSAENLLINTVSVFLFAFGKAHSNEKLMSRAIKMLENLPCENNNIISSFITAGIKVNTADRSQAVIGLQHNYCAEKRCLECGIGNKILKLN